MGAMGVFSRGKTFILESGRVKRGLWQMNRDGIGTSPKREHHQSGDRVISRKILTIIMAKGNVGLRKETKDREEKTI